MTNSRNTNRLINEKSPYLLQHAHNPVDWYSWGSEAFEKARTEDKPIFLSIGYSTCHWCHVMERESFEDEEVGSLLNSHYVSIKVDREERPDIDHIYMTFCQALTGQGGWPLTVIMTPDRKPFFAGTYFPKKSKWGRPGLVDILHQIHQKWQEDRDGIVDIGDDITRQVSTRFAASSAGELTQDTLDRAYRDLKKGFDTWYGGFGGAPKFPTPHNLTFLMRYWKQSGEKYALDMVEKTLQAMHSGGIYDHVGFGFSRYSTDREWLTPHFEKMLYDNALLALAYLDAYQITGRDVYARVAREIFTYVLRDMTGPGGGFYSAEDADSEGVEGKFYVWTPGEVKEVLGQQDGEFYCRIYRITPEGNFEGHSIPNLINKPLDEVAREEGLPYEALYQRLEGMREKLFLHREGRVHPHKDDKVLTAWNGLMIATMARGAAVLGEKKYALGASRAADFILKNLRGKEGRLLARYRDGESAFPAYLDDYAFLAWGLLELYQATLEPEHLGNAMDITKEMLELFWDQEDGGFFFYGSDAEQLLARPKEVYDGAMPSGNSVAALNLLRLARLTGNMELEDCARRQMKAFAGDVDHNPRAHTQFLTALQFALGPAGEIVLAGDPGDQGIKEMIRTVRRKFLPHTVLILRFGDKKGRELERLIPFIKEKSPIDGKPTAYICENFACRSPVTDPEQFKNMIH